MCISLWDIDAQRDDWSLVENVSEPAGAVCRPRKGIFGRGPWALAASGTDTSTFEVIYLSLSTRLEGVQQLHGPLENLLCGNQLGRPARLQGQLFCDRIRKTD